MTHNMPINTPSHYQSHPDKPYVCLECLQRVRHAAFIFTHSDVNGTSDVCLDCWTKYDYGFFYTDQQIVSRWGLMAWLIPNGEVDGVPQWTMTKEFLAELKFLRGPNRVREGF